MGGIDESLCVLWGGVSLLLPRGVVVVAVAVVVAVCGKEIGLKVVVVSIWKVVVVKVWLTVVLVSVREVLVELCELLVFVWVTELKLALVEV
jgi:hypothetical protein